MNILFSILLIFPLICVYFPSFFYFLFCIPLHLLHRAYCTVISTACALYARVAPPHPSSCYCTDLGTYQTSSTVAHSRDLKPNLSLHRRHDWQRVLRIQPPG